MAEPDGSCGDFEHANSGLSSAYNPREHALSAGRMAEKLGPSPFVSGDGQYSFQASMQRPRSLPFPVSSGPPHFAAAAAPARGAAADDEGAGRRFNSHPTTGSENYTVQFQSPGSLYPPDNDEFIDYGEHQGPLPPPPLPSRAPPPASPGRSAHAEGRAETEMKPLGQHVRWPPAESFGAYTSAGSRHAADMDAAPPPAPSRQRGHPQLYAPGLNTSRRSGLYKRPDRPRSSMELESSATPHYQPRRDAAPPYLRSHARSASHASLGRPSSSADFRLGAGDGPGHGASHGVGHGAGYSAVHSAGYGAGHSAVHSAGYGASSGAGSGASSGAKGHKYRHAGRSHRRKSSRSADSQGSAPLSAALVTPTFVPGMPVNGGAYGAHNSVPPGGMYWALRSTQLLDEGLGAPSAEEPLSVPIQMCQPPLSNIVPTYPLALDGDPQPRVRKQSKYTAEQDRLILELKNEGKTWAEIAKLARCHNQLAARNRYQVLIGQQGGGTFFWTAEDCAALQAVLDEGERAKWLYVAAELTRKMEAEFSLEAVFYKISEIFARCPEQFGVIRTKDPRLGGAPLKRVALYPEERQALPPAAAE